MGSLEREVCRHRSAAWLPWRLSGRIDAKFQRHLHSYGMRLDPLAKSLKANPGLIDQAKGIPQLNLFFCSHVVIALAQAPNIHDLWCRDLNDWVTVVRYPNRLHISNPHSGKEESWGSLRSASQEDYSVHRRVGGRSIKSRFKCKLPYIETLEREVLAEGKGLLLSENTMRLYAVFESPIGMSSERDELNYMCLEIERVRRPRRRPNSNGKRHQSGWMLSVHGYPLSDQDLQKDLQGMQLTLRMIPQLRNPA